MESASELRKLRKEALAWAKEELLGQVLFEPGTGKEIVFTMKGIKELVNQPHAHYVEKLDAIRHILELFPYSDYMGQSLDEDSGQYCFRYYRTQVGGEDSFFVVRENLHTGLVDMYSLVDKIKE